MNIHSTPKLTAAETALVDAFGERLSYLPGDATVTVKRDDAVEVLKAGLPTRRVEAWHYTDLRRLLTAVPGYDPTLAARAKPALLAGSTVLPVLNGVAGATAKIDGVSVSKLIDKLLDGSFAPALGAQEDADAVGALNTAFVADGWFIDIAARAEVSGPIEIQNVQAGGQTHSRFPVRVGEGAKATIVERQTGEGDALVSSISHLTLAKDAELTWIIVQDHPEGATHFGQFNAELAEGAKLTLFIMNAGSKLVRQEVRVRMPGEGSDFQLRGINLLTGDTHCDVTMMLDHLAENTTSTEIVRNVANGTAKGVFQGQIRVAKEAQKTDARMACNTLLLSDEAEFSTKPELEIFADDVACGHGATVTEIDRNHLFYLMARGIDEKTARGLLVKAFVAEIIEELEDEPTVEVLEGLLDEWFAAHV
ncbi:Fe-S cluster assembly protein SufD [Mesorhizobium australicum]|uniref:Fe-S cluster assembly protein SufD n=1 Tax=Mesorhizobium australicum TaxID=536018 RepID=A0A1X7P6E8_9HYPH|nr:Fe-S cluster assembly protein SufD [Mesorhizobium australicum]SMH45860.1 Fe-S cluster assembly protein SufD [Mesorhizobium australicum]